MQITKESNSNYLTELKTHRSEIKTAVLFINAECVCSNAGNYLYAISTSTYPEEFIVKKNGLGAM